MTEKAPAFQFYPADFLADEHVALMSSDEIGIYMLLLCHCWLSGSLTSDERALARLSRVTTGQFARAWRRIGSRFTLDEHGRLRNPRLDKEREKQAAYRDRAVRGGKAKAANGLLKPCLTPAKDVQQAASKQPFSSALQSSSSSSTSVKEKDERALMRSYRPLSSGPNPRIVFHGKVEVWDWMHAKFKKRLGTEDAESKLSAFYVATNAKWEAEGIVPAGKEYDIWLGAFNAAFGTSNVVDEAAAAKAKFLAMGKS